MDFSIQQIYAMFAMLTASAVAGLFFYCIGLRTGQTTGYEHGRKTAALHWRKLLKVKQESNDELRAELATRHGELFALRQNIKSEAFDHAKTVDYLQRQFASAPFNEDDRDVLSAVHGKLLLAANTFDALDSPDQARFSRDLQAKVGDIINRITAAQATDVKHPDSELIDWLENDASVDFDLERCTISFVASPGSEIGITNIRDLLKTAKFDSESMAFDQILLEAEQETAA
ncbi:hypothetical protein [Pseudomonas sp. S9]|uniref:hypothetical protein n=1 Tax=Pseudomonas sp. S9 TaxID=686578 RepID=UPI0002556FE1|nr:hypothetical protein [Pseudomonas sp. S9]